MIRPPSTAFEASLDLPALPERRAAPSRPAERAGGSGGPTATFLPVEDSLEAPYRLRFEPFSLEYLSPSIELLTGYTPAEIARIGFHSLVERIESVSVIRRDAAAGIETDDMARIREAEKAGRIEQFRADYRLRTRNGERIWVSDRSRPWRDTDSGEVVGTVGVLQNITERKAAETALRRDRDFMAAVVDTAGALVLVVDAGGRIVRFNRACEAVAGRSFAEVEGRCFWDVLLTGEDRAESRAEFARLSASGFPRDEESVWVAASGEQRRIAWRRSVLTDDEGGVTHIVATGQDITERVRAEASLRENETRYRSVVTQTGEGIYLLDLESRRFVEANPAFLRLTGYSTEEITSLTLYDIVSHSRAEVDRNIENVRASGSFTVGERRYRRKDGSLIDVEIGATTLMLRGREKMCVVVRDITERRRAEEELRHVLTGARCLLWHATVEESAGNAEGFAWSLHISNEDAAQQFLPLNVFPPKNYARVWSESLLPGERARIYAISSQALRAGESAYSHEFRCRDRDGRLHWLREDVRLQPLLERDAEVEAITGTDGSPPPRRRRWSAVGVCTDITDRKAAEIERESALVELGASRERYRNLFQNIPTGIYRTTPDGRILMANPALVRLLGYVSFEELAANNLEQETPYAAYDRREFRERLERDGEIRGWEVAWTRRDGETVFVRENARAVRNPDDGVILYYEGTVEDISERRQAEEMIRRQAFYDALTGLPNRALFHDRLTQALHDSEQYGRQAAVLFLDLDRFKQINDSLGHAAGDRLLQEVGQRLARAVRADDTVARMARKLRRTLARPLVLDGHEFYVTGSIGISVYPGDGLDSHALIKHADIAMYGAKRQGGDAFQVYAKAMNASTLERLVMETDLRKALTRNELALFYQPQVRLIGKGAEAAADRVEGVEALVRWRHPREGLLPPARFIPLAEETGLIGALGEWTLREACRQGALWHAEGHILRVSVNLSARQFLQQDLSERVSRILKETGFNGRYLDLELTETALMEHGDSARETLVALKSLGVRIFVDDFGTGYASLLYLRQFPLDALKVDRSFVRGMTSGPEDAAIVRAVIDLAHALGMGVIAEGVETEPQRALLRELGCDAMQGFLFSAPVPPEDLIALLPPAGA